MFLLKRQSRKSDKSNNKDQERPTRPLHPVRKMQIVIRASRSQSLPEMHEQKTKNPCSLSSSYFPEHRPEPAIPHIVNTAATPGVLQGIRVPPGARGYNLHFP